MISLPVIMGQITCVISGVCCSTSYDVLSIFHFLWLYYYWWCRYDGEKFFLQQFCHQQFACWREFYCYSDFFLPGRVWGDISRYSFPVNFVAQDHSQDENCPGRCRGIRDYFYTNNDISYIRSYAKGCVCWGIFIYMHLGTSHAIFRACSGRDWLCA